MQSSVGHDKSDLKVKLAIVAGLSFFVAIIGLGVVIYPSSSLATQSADWQAHAQASGYSETHEAPSILAYLLAGIEYIGKSFHVA